jgi:hypothetical protein
MQWPTTVLVFPPFPTILGLIKKRAAPYPNVIVISDVYSSYSPCISSMVLALRDRENFQTAGKFPSPPPHLPLKHLYFIVFGLSWLNNCMMPFKAKQLRIATYLILVWSLSRLKTTG